MCAEVNYEPHAPLGLIAGTGALPQHILAQHGGLVHVIAIEGNTPHELVQDVPHTWCRIAAVGKALQALRAADAAQMVLAGHITRPSMRSLLPDRHGAALLKRLGGEIAAGDNRLLSTITSYFEEQGIRIIGAHHICTDMVLKVGCATRTKPDKSARTDIDKGQALLEALSPFDVGQAVMVQGGHVVGIEAAEGTAGLLERIAHLPQARGGVLVKLPKAGQELRVDMPAIGMDTMQSAHAAGLRGIAIGANATLLLDKCEMLDFADRHAMFIVAINV